MDRFRDWKSTAIPNPSMFDKLGSTLDLIAVKGEPILFFDREDFSSYTLPPQKKDFDYDTALGTTFEVLEGELECVPHKMPLAVWTIHHGFEVLGREEEELLARYAFKGFKPVTDRPYFSVDFEASEDYLESYDWESKEFWRNAGWFLAIHNWWYPVEGISYPPTFREEGVFYEFESATSIRSGCWRVPNVADLPNPRPCIECERHRNMTKEVRAFHERDD